MLLIAAMVSAAIGLVVWRREALRSEDQLDSLLSREAVFLFQNLVLVAMVFVIFWVTFFPLISEAVTGTKVSVGPPAFRPFIVPAGAGPGAALRHRPDHRLAAGDGGQPAAQLHPSRGRRPAHARRAARWPAASRTRPFALPMFALGAFVVATVPRSSGAAPAPGGR